MQEEARTTEKMLSRVPADKMDWAPHTKSMTLQALAGHVAELPGWVAMTLVTDELDFAKQPYTSPKHSTSDDLLRFHADSFANAIETLNSAQDATLDGTWTMRNGEEVYFSSPRWEMIQSCISQTIHHRAQLGVYLRMLDIPIPGSYGPSADEM